MYHLLIPNWSKSILAFGTIWFLSFSQPTRIKYGFLEDGTKVRVSKKTGSVIPKPDRSDLKYINRTKNKEQGDLDTLPEDVIEKTYKGEDFVKVYNEF